MARQTENASFDESLLDLLTEKVGFLQGVQSTVLVFHVQLVPTSIKAGQGKTVKPEKGRKGGKKTKQ